MIEYSVETRHKEIKHKSNQYYGGHITYIKLYFQLIALQVTAIKTLSLKQSFEMWFIFILKTPWWLVIKPFGCMYSYTQTLKGDFYYFVDPYTETKTIDEKRFRVKKYVTHKLFRIPVFKHQYIITKEDRDKLVQ